MKQKQSCLYQLRICFLLLVLVETRILLTVERATNIGSPFPFSEYIFSLILTFIRQFAKRAISITDELNKLNVNNIFEGCQSRKNNFLTFCTYANLLLPKLPWTSSNFVRWRNNKSSVQLNYLNC